MDYEESRLESHYKELLKPNMTFKNYKELCIYLGQDIKDGKRAKEYQIKSWNRMFEFSRMEGSNKLLITEVFDDVMESTDKRKTGNNTKFVPFIEKIVLAELWKRPKSPIIITNETYFERFGVTNMDVRFEDFDREILAFEGMTQFHVSEFKHNALGMLYQTFGRSFESMNRRKLITYEKYINIEGERERTFDISTTIERADANTEAFIRNCEKEVCVEMGLKSLQQVFAMKIESEFFSKVYAKIQRKEKISRYYRVSEIKLIEQNDLTQNPQVSEEELRHAKETLKGLLLESFLKSMDSRVKNVMGKAKERRAKKESEVWGVMNSMAIDAFERGNFKYDTHYYKSMEILALRVFE